MSDVMPVSHRSLLWLSAGFAGPVAVALILVPLEHYLPSPAIAMILVVPVVLVARSGSRLVAVIAAFSAALSFDFLFTEPRGSFVVSKTDDIVLVATLLAVGLLVAQASALRVRHDIDPGSNPSPD